MIDLYNITFQEPYYLYLNLNFVWLHLLRRKDGQDRRGSILLEDPFYPLTIPPGEIMHTTSSQLLSTLCTKNIDST